MGLFNQASCVESLWYSSKHTLCVWNNVLGINVIGDLCVHVHMLVDMYVSGHASMLNVLIFPLNYMCTTYKRGNVLDVLNVCICSHEAHENICVNVHVWLSYIYIN